MRRLIAAIGLVMLLSGCPTFIPSSQFAHSRVIDVKGGNYVNAASRFSFPPEFDGFQRVAVTQFDEKEENVGVGYNLDEQLKLTLTLYVRRPLRKASGEPMTLQEEFELEQAAIVEHHAGAQLGPRWIPPQTHNEEPAPGTAASFTYRENFAREERPVVSLLYLFEFDGWVVKYRITFAAMQEAQARPVAEEFVSSFLWRGGA